MLITLTVIFTAAWTLTRCACTGRWALLPVRLLEGVLVCTVLLALVLLAAAALVKKENPDEKRFPFYRRLMAELSVAALKLGRVSVSASGLELLPEGGCMLAQNHLSGFDPVVLYALLKGLPLGFVSKKENLRLPVAGRLMAGAGVLSLDRDDARQGAVVIANAARRIQSGDLMCIYPEGTRSKTGALGPFHNGCFKAALKAHAPLAVVTVHGTENIKTNFLRRRTDVTVTVKHVFPEEELEKMDTFGIGEAVRREMERV